MRFIYTLIFIIALPVIIVRLWVKDKKVPGYRIRWPERFGWIAPLKEDRKVIWVHAVSVGEVIAATPLVNRLLDEDNLALIITTMTPTGSTRVLKAFGDKVYHVYAPYDLPWTVATFLRRTKPSLAIIMETELWPNTLHTCAEFDVPTLLANARMSSRSARGYLRFPKTTKQLINLIDMVGVQNKKDGERFLQMGLSSERLRITGSIKFDISIEGKLKQAAITLKRQFTLGERAIFIAASTHEGEDEVILDAFTKILNCDPSCLLLLIPRHPERFDDVTLLAQERFTTLRRSLNQAPSAETQVVVGDTMGEMMLLYGIADFAFVGGSLIERGGHNMIEPASWGLPVLSGPHTFNFADISSRLIECGGMFTTANADEIADMACKFLTEPNFRKQAGRQALSFTEQNRGALNRLMDLVKPYLD